MKEVRIEFFDLIEIDRNDINKFINHLLIANGFDLSKSFIYFDDFEKSQMVFKQDEEVI